MKTRFRAVPALALAAALWCAATPAAAATLVNDGSNHTVAYTLSNVAQDFTIPSSSPPAYIEVSIRGGQGGRADSGNCDSRGGYAAFADAVFEVGTGSGQLRPGGQLRFVVGQRGGNDSVGLVAAGGGGGGSAVLYKGPSDANWTLLAVAGGGGGAYQSELAWVCKDSHNGGSAQTGEDGGAGGNHSGSGGSGGCEGTSIADGAGAGGSHLDCFIDYPTDGKTGYPAGGAGGGGINGGVGGWGYGGGGGGSGSDVSDDGRGGGGGGGYSSGGAGEEKYHGGGGGSYVSSWSVEEQIWVSNGGGDGTANYRCFDGFGATNCADAGLISDGTYDGHTANGAINLTVGCNSAGVPRAVWYRFENNESWPQVVTVDPANFANTVVAADVFSDCAGTVVACSPSIFFGTPTTWTIQPGETHYIRVGAADAPNSFTGRPYEFTLSSEIAPITNTTCASGLELPMGTSQGIIWGGGGSSGPLPCGQSVNSDAWYTFTSSSFFERQFEVTVTPTSNSDELGLESKAGCAGATTACAPGNASAAPTTIVMNVPGQGTGRFRVASKFGNTSEYEITINQLPDVTAPAAPTNISADYQASGVSLDWDDAPEADFELFRIYRGTSPGFTPAPGNLVKELTASNWVDPTPNPWGYHYKLFTKDTSGNLSPVGTPGSVSDVGESTLPTLTVLREAYPNPFNPSTRLSFDLATPARARLSIYDVSGRLVNSLVDEQFGAGRHEVVWNGRNDAGSLVSSGMYLYRFEADGVVQMKRMMLLK